ncbi:cardiolipin synthase [Paenibacillus taihuensis]|uniref:Cardiolipin synthase n=1 Tax=Paenibacillus taihuensis TaxID=1156355 RepID=A0A3D9SLM1_9BACL|nr:cardiolipin synthase [Paenibacillus taihuensis]REE92795.1 cardiolipin synthase [Paenibacillus taihuensis]
MIWLLAALLIFIFQIATILILEYRHPAKSLAWLLILFVLPIIGFVMYYFLAQEYQRRRRIRKRGIYMSDTLRRALLRCKLIHRQSDMQGNRFEQQERLYHILQNLSVSPITGCNESTVLANGEATYSAMFEAIAEAKHHVHVESYTIRDDRIGRQLKELLIERARAGVEVRVIYDGIGSVELNDNYVEELLRAGVEMQCFLSPRIAFFEKRMNFRNHRKIIVVDGLVGFVGGINFGEEYVGGNPKLGFWRDTHLRLRGDAVYFLQEVFMYDWWYTSKKKLTGAAYLPEHSCESMEQVQIVQSGPNMRDDAILEYVFAAVSAGKSRIYITTPYFIPDASILMALRTAALGGVDVRVIIPYVPDTKFVLMASLSYVEEMLAVGVRIYRYRAGFVHAKVVIVDKLLASVGTANMDMRSFYSNFEINALLFDEAAIERLTADFMDDLSNCVEVSLSEFRKRPMKQKVGEAAARMLSPLL